MPVSSAELRYETRQARFAEVPGTTGPLGGRAARPRSAADVSAQDAARLRGGDEPVRVLLQEEALLHQLLRGLLHRLPYPS